MDTVRVLLVEDFPPDAELAKLEIHRSIPNCEFKLVKTRNDFLNTLEVFDPHVIVSDYMMPQFDGMTALKLTLEKTHLIPFILFTGSMNEDIAVECMKMGATDYIIKEHIKRLGQSVKNALEKRKIVLDKIKAEEQTKHYLERLQSLVEISQYKTESIQDLLDKALNEIVKLTKSKMGYIFHYFEERKEFEVHAWSKDAMEGCKIDNPQHTYQLDKTGIWGEVIRQRKPIIVNDFTVPNVLKKGYPEGHVDLKRYLSIPIFIESKIVAVAAVANKQTDYTEADIDQLTLMMNSVWKMVQQKETDAELHENEEKYKAIMDQSIDNIYLADTVSLQILEANPSICSFLGYTLPEIKRLKIFDIAAYPEENISGLTKILKEKKKMNLGERNYKKKNGEIVIVEANASILNYQKKEVICVISHDITNRKIADLALYQSTEKLRMILNYSPIGTATFDESGFLTGSNNSFKETFCLPLFTEATNFNLFHEKLLTEKDKDIVQNGEMLTIEKTFSIEELESILHFKMNRSGRIDLELMIKAVEMNPATHNLEFLLQVEDITERKKVENIKNEFINTVSHEMRTPLTSIRETVMILKNHYSGNLVDDQKMLIDMLLRNINRLGKLIQDVLDFQKLNTVMMNFNLKPSSINELISQIILDLSSFRKKNVSINTDLDGNIPLVKMDRDRISQVLINLINNSVKFTQEGLISVKTELEAKKDRVKISIIDTGIGISKENLQKIFLPFYQIKKEIEHQSEGTGLGLSICKKILENHDSGLYVKSEIDKGSTFYFYLQTCRS